MGELAVSAVSFAKSTHAYLFSDNLDMVIPLAQATAGVAAFVDAVLAFALIALLHRQKNSFETTIRVVAHVTHIIVGTGLITGACALAGLISSLIWPNNFIFILFLELLPKRELQFLSDQVLIFISTPQCTSIACSHRK